MSVAHELRHAHRIAACELRCAAEFRVGNIATPRSGTGHAHDQAARVLQEFYSPPIRQLPYAPTVVAHAAPFQWQSRAETTGPPGPAIHTRQAGRVPWQLRYPKALHRNP